MKRRILLPILFSLFSFAALAQDFSKLYATGDAFGGWDSEKPKEFILVEPGIFKWSGYLYSGNFKFLLTKGSWDNCLIAKTMDDIVVVGQTHSLKHEERQEDDYKFIISSPGEYEITVNVNSLTMVVTERTAVDLPYNLWIIGSAIPGGSAKLTVDYDIEGKFYYKGGLQDGGFVVANKSTLAEATMFVVPVTQNADANGGSQWEKISSAPIKEWKVETPDLYYTLTIDAGTQLLDGVIFDPNIELYIVGGATDIGWDPYSAIPLEQNFDKPAEYVFEGELRINDDGRDQPNLFKFLLQKEWNPRSFHPLTENESIYGSSAYILNGADYKWSVPEDKQGNYQITVDIFYETLQVVYLDEQSGVNSPFAEKPFTAYPQEGQVNISVNNSAAIESARLFDTTGKFIAERKNQMTHFSIGNHLSKGVYILQITAKGESYAEKILVK